MTIKHKVFAAYSVLKADDVNTYLMNQTAVNVDLESELTSLPLTVKVAYVTATGKVHHRKQDNAWTIGMEDSGWIDTANPTTPITRGVDGMRYRKKNGVVFFQLHGAYQGSYADNFTVLTLPAGYRPAWNHSFAGTLYGPYNAMEVRIPSNGAVILMGRGITAAGFVASGSFVAGT